MVDMDIAGYQSYQADWILHRDKRAVVDCVEWFLDRRNSDKGLSDICSTG